MANWEDPADGTLAGRDMTAAERRQQREFLRRWEEAYPELRTRRRVDDVMGVTCMCALNAVVFLWVGVVIGWWWFG